MGAKHAPPEERFWRFVNKTPTCWLWTGADDGTFGYGRLKVGNNRQRDAHRLSYEIAHGPIPTGLFVLHKCDNPRCVNPDHLFLGTQLDNMRDRFSKGHRIRTRAKFTDAQVRDIRALYWESTEPLYLMQDLAKQYGVIRNTISQIVNFKSYRDIQ